MAFVGIEIGGTKLQLFAGDASGTILDRRRISVEPARGAEGIRESIQETLPALIKQWNAQGICVGFGGPVNWRTGTISRSHQIEGWSGFAIGEWLRGIADRPVHIDNDADLGALGEASRGAGQGFNPVFYVTLGSGVGGGLVVNSNVYHGAHPGEAEIGHIRLDREGTIVEHRCSGWAVDARIRELRKRGSASVLVSLTAGMNGGEARALGQALAAKDGEAIRILRETTRDLAFGLSHVIHLFHPEVIVLGGGLSLLGEPLRAAVADALPEFVMEVFAGTTQVRLAALGEDAVPVGCLVQAGKMSAVI
jgi:glucokinase